MQLQSTKKFILPFKSFYKPLKTFKAYLRVVLPMEFTGVPQ